ncbi:U32 family peptidase [uncultured Ruthenibacterium sp.]|uniref:peptidase U32 family protein n=1 Tax=uncultured Ruthenibacterium sp. TaxID=1905347 RepID=UPI00349EC184
MSPAGDLERLRFAVLYGADAVYIGATEFGMRSAPKNFTMEQIRDGVLFAHEHGKRVYLTLNTIPTNEEIARMPDFVRQVSATGIDAFIVADLGVLAIVKKYAPDIEIHLSTQVGISNYMSANMAYELGAKRVVLARELSLKDIAVIRDNTPADLELEAFVHGAMCMSYSGRCLLSHYLTGRDANRGECTQPCRWSWSLVEEHRPDRHFPIGETDEGSYILNADDLCTAPFLNLICEAGVDSLKIEGRAKTFYYVASTTAAYRKALDAYLEDPNAFVCPENVLEELTKISHRRYSPGFYFGKEDAIQNTRTGGYIRGWEVVGVVGTWDDGIAFCTQRGKWQLGDEVEILTPSGDVISIQPDWIRDGDGQPISSTPHAMMQFSIPVGQRVSAGSILRRKRK